MRKKTFYLLLIWLLLLARFVYAEEISVTVKTDKPNAVLGETIIFQIEEHNVDTPVKPELTSTESFDVKYLGQNQPSTFHSITIINGQRTEIRRSTTAFQYEITPKTHGTLTIPSLQINIQGNVYSTSPVNITVFKEAPGNQFVTIDILTNSKEYFLNQQLKLTIQITSNKPIAGELSCNIPWFDSYEGFLAQEVDVPQDGQKINVIVNGKYRVPFAQEVKTINNEQRLVLSFSRIFFPIAKGEFVIPGVSLQGTVATELGQNVWGETIAKQTQKVVKTSQPLSIVVNPLPEENKPAEFSGGVGFFTMDVQAQPKKVRLGDSIDLTIKIEGAGNIEQVNIPIFSDASKFKTYQPKSETKITDKTNLIMGEKVFYQTVVPKESGNQMIPSLVFTYFDPHKKDYQIIKSSPIPIEVEKTETDLVILDSNLSEIDVEKIKVLKKDISPIMQDIRGLKSHTLYLYQTAIFWLILVVPIGLVIFCILLKKRIDRFRDDFRYVRYLQASKVCKKHLATACKLLNETDSEEFYDILSQAVTNFLADKLNIPPASITPDYIAQQLTIKNIPADTLRELKSLFEAIDFGRFASSKVTIEDKQTVLKKAEELIKIIGKRLTYEA